MGELLLELINNWVVVGITVIISAFSQWRTISLFHVFICSNLATTIPIISPTWTGIIERPSYRLMLQRAYFIFFSLSRISLSAYLIHRFRCWENTPGQCFVLPPTPWGDLLHKIESLRHISAVQVLIFGSALRIISQSVGIVLSIKAAVVEFRWHEIGETLQECLEDWKQRPARVRRRNIIIQVSILFLNFVIPLIWNTYWTTRIVLANHSHLLGDEYTFTFGQVSALVAFVASFYAIANSYIRKQWVPSW